MISYTDHARIKMVLELRKHGVTEAIVAQIMNKPDEVLHDAQTNRDITISWSHKTAVVYETKGSDHLIITIIYSSTLRDTVKRRRRSGRWTQS